MINCFLDWVLERMDEKGRKDLMTQLNRPPASATKEQVRSSNEWDPGAAGAGFMAQLAARGGGAAQLTRDGVKNVQSQ